jgi:hypothetical protein
MSYRNYQLEKPNGMTNSAILLIILSYTIVIISLVVWNVKYPDKMDEIKQIKCSCVCHD